MAEQTFAIILDSCLGLHCVMKSATWLRQPVGHCEVELQKGQLDTIDPQTLIGEAVDLLSEALVRLDAVMEHQAAALVDHAINILAGWTSDTSDDHKISLSDPH